MNKVRIGFDRERDLIVAFHEERDDIYKAFYLCRDKGHFKRFNSDEVGFNSVEKELTEEQVMVVFDTIKELLNDI